VSLRISISLQKVQPPAHAVMLSLHQHTRPFPRLHWCTLCLPRLPNPRHSIYVMSIHPSLAHLYGQHTQRLLATRSLALLEANALSDIPANPATLMCAFARLELCHMHVLHALGKSLYHSSCEQIPWLRCGRCLVNCLQVFRRERSVRRTGGCRAVWNSAALMNTSYFSKWNSGSEKGLCSIRCLYY
jgi:hypothetical protein